MNFLTKIFGNDLKDRVDTSGEYNTSKNAGGDAVQPTVSVYHEDRPWGSFDRYTHNQKSTVKIITVNKGQATSLQYHHHRSEYWVVVSGNGKLHIGESVLESEVGKMYEVPLGTEHRIEGTGDLGLTIMEISLGDFDEADIVRLEDVYGRSDK